MSKKLTTEEFIFKSKKVHGDRYDYSKSKLNGTHSKIIITCKVHGDFNQIAKDHFRGVNCPECGKLKRKKSKLLTQENFIERCNLKHNYKYNYDKTVYKKLKDKIIITCPIHGDFEQSACSHLLKNGCSKCSKRYKPNKEEFIKKAQLVHGDLYDYSISFYTNNKTNISIICRKHGIFNQTPQNHIKNKSRCPKCNNPSFGEVEVEKILTDKKVYFQKQKKFQKCKHINMLPFDFYIPQKNLCIEFDGKQHFEDTDSFFKTNNFDLIKKRDEIKNNFCKENNIKLLRIPYFEINKIESILNTVLAHE